MSANLKSNYEVLRLNFAFKNLETIANKIIEFNKHIVFNQLLPQGFAVMNPFVENPETMQVMAQFYKKFYDDHFPRHFIIGINPSRHGAGLTGVPFTDTKRLESACGIRMQSAYSHEVSSVFIYDMIDQYGGAKKFYSKFYINSPFPLAIIRNKNGKWINANYYDDAELFKAVKSFMIQTLRQHIAIGLETKIAFVLGKKNAVFLKSINRTEKLFGRLEVLEHPRFIQQYRSKYKDLYIAKYFETLDQLKG